MSAGVGLFVSLPVAAQTTGDGTDTTIENSPDIIVTAQRREQRLQDIPIAVSAFSEEEIVNSGMQRLDDVAAFTPGLELNGWQSIGFAAPRIRGVSADAARIGAEPAAGVYVDEVYFGSNSILNSALFDVERVEVLRGPQGTLYGKNTIGGAINIVLTKPSQDLEGSAQVEVGNYDLMRLRGAINVPLTETLATRFSFFLNSRDGYTFNRFDGSSLNDANGIGGRLAFRWYPNETTTIDFGAMALRDRATGRAADVGDPTLKLVPEILLGYRDGNPFDFSVSHNHRSVENRDMFVPHLRVQHETSSFDIISVTSFMKFDYENPADTDSSPFDFVVDNVRGDQKQFSQELRFVSNDPASRLQWLGGLYFLRTNLHAESLIILGKDLSIFGLPEDVANSFADQVTTSYAAFAQATLKATDRLNLTSGLRVTHERKKFDFSQDGGQAGLFATVAPGSAEASWTFLSGVLTADYEWRPGLMTYITGSRGSKSGGFNDGLNGPAALTPYDPEHLWNLEGGIKAAFFENRVFLNVAAYHMWWRDIQTRFLPPGTTNFIVVNSGRATRPGVEIELVTRPLAGLEVAATFEHQVRGKSENVLNPQQELARVNPKYSGSFRAQYAHAVSQDTELVLRGEYSYRSSTRNSATQPDPALDLEVRNLLNARIGFRAIDDRWGFALWGRNLTNQAYIVNAGDLTTAFGAGFPLLPKQVWLGEPRTYGVEFRVSF